jgi:hypothetical protein
MMEVKPTICKVTISGQAFELSVLGAEISGSVVRLVCNQPLGSDVPANPDQYHEMEIELGSHIVQGEFWSPDQREHNGHFYVDFLSSKTYPKSM